MSFKTLLSRFHSYNNNATVTTSKRKDDLQSPLVMENIMGIGLVTSYCVSLHDLELQDLTEDDNNSRKDSVEHGNASMLALVYRWMEESQYPLLEKCSTCSSPYCRQDPEDLKKCVEGMIIVIDMINSKAFSKFCYHNMSVQDLIDLMLNLPVNLRPKHANISFSLEQYCIDIVLTIYHYHGGCQSGKAVDHNYKVIGIEALRVIDASLH
ncbi:Protein HOTHEAD [Glycine soja]